MSLVPRVPEHVDLIYEWWLEHPDFYPHVEFPTFSQYMQSYDKRADALDETLWSIAVDRVEFDEGGEDGEDTAFDQEIVGITELAGFGDSQTCVGSYLYVIPEERGKGYGSEAVKLRTAYAYQELDLELLETTVDARNKVAQRLLERAGYRRTGERPHAFRENGQWQNLYFFALLREWWEKHAGA